MPVGTGLAILGSAALSGVASGVAGRKQAKAADQSRILQESIYNKTSRKFDPFRKTGVRANNALAYLNGVGEQPEGFAGFEASPGYDFRRQQGLDAIEASAAARGGLFSTGAARDAQTFGDGLASQEYGAFYNRLAGQQQVGLQAAGNQAVAGQNFATGASQSLADRGNALSAGIIGTGNAINTGIGNYIGYQQFNKLLDGIPQ